MIQGAVAIAILFVGLVPGTAEEETLIERFFDPGTEVASRTTEMVKVSREGGLVHTRLLLGRDTGKGDFGTGDLVEQLRVVCRAHEVTLGNVVRLNLYLGDGRPDLEEAVQGMIESNWPRETRPVITAVVSKLPGDARVGADAVFVISRDENSAAEVTRFERETAIAPSGRDLLYVSGRAARSGTLSEACSDTMAQLMKVVGELGAGPLDVVQVKAFVQPMKAWSDAESAIEAAFGDRGSPPIVFVEWASSLPTEIEMIVSAPAGSASGKGEGAGISYFTPDGDKPSPVFSRVARVSGSELVYSRGLITPAGSDHPGEAVRKSFQELELSLERVGSDLRHLAKATYYVSDPDLSQSLNAVRPDFYDPARPPAASKVSVETMGAGARSGQGLLMDFIGVPVPSGRGE